MKPREAFAPLLTWLLALLISPAQAGSVERIDRHALVSRHDVVIKKIDLNNPLTVGNGEFAFTADVTGLQTFADSFSNTVPLGTLSQWAWHTAPNPGHWSPDQYHYREFDVFGRKVGYNDVFTNNPPDEVMWRRGNPHRLHLGQISFVLTKSSGAPASAGDLADIDQKLDLWDGILRSHFKLEGRPVDVETVCHPDRDLLAVRVVSSLLRNGGVKIKIQFPYGTGSMMTADWSKPEAHSTWLTLTGPNEAQFERRLDDDSYIATAHWSRGATLKATGRHQFLIEGHELGAGNVPFTEPVPAADAFHREITAPEIHANAAVLEFVCEFSRDPPKRKLPDFEQTRSAAQAHWNQFWSTGGAIDLSGSSDPRWAELERRIVLSQYLTAIQCAGTLPPQETGLTYNSWEGKFHLEMHWWHEAHFALWNRAPLLEKSLGYYQEILPRAQALARRQGYTGARWPKMTDPSGVDSPSPVGPFLIWQQPHPIFLAELCYRAHPDRATLVRYKEVVAQSAEFMSSFAEWEPEGKRFVLGPVLQCAQEIFPKERTFNPTFELTYWRWGLEVAQQWRLRFGMSREPEWDRVLTNLAVPAVEQDKYLFAETAVGTYTQKKWVKDHPSVTAAFGMLPGPGIDPGTMSRTFHWILDNWDWPDTWGWDYPMLAMCAARLGEPERAVDALLLETPKNHFWLNGHNYQRPGLNIYLAGNGGLLYATAMMAAGWDGAPKRHAPGFPDNGRWNVRYENLRPAP